MQDTASEHGYTLLVFNSDGKADTEENALRAMHSRRVDSVVVASASATATPALRELMESGCPVVAVDRMVRDAAIDQVLVDVWAGTRDAVVHLAEQGCRRIGFLAGPRRLWTAGEKLRGYRSGLKIAGLPFDGDLVYAGDYSQSGGHEQAQRMLARRPIPDGLVVANNLMTLGVLAALLRSDVHMPEDLAVVGFDDAPWATVLQPTLSVIAQPTADLGRTAIELLLRRLRGDVSEPVRCKLQPELILRESSRRR
jgi:LacI family transcriptional regulator